METKTVSHYYGDCTRGIFVITGLIILLGLPTITSMLLVPIGYPIAAIILLAIAAGVTNPVQKVSFLLNMVVSIVGLAIFIYLSWYMQRSGITGFYFLLNQLLAVLFLLASYFSIKSVRGKSLSA